MSFFLVFACAATWVATFVNKSDFGVARTIGLEVTHRCHSVSARLQECSSQPLFFGCWRAVNGAVFALVEKKHLLFVSNGDSVKRASGSQYQGSRHWQTYWRALIQGSVSFVIEVKMSR